MSSIWEWERCVCELTDQVRKPQNVLSHHLGVLRQAGLVSVRRDGRWAYYRPADDLDAAGEAALTAMLGERGYGRAVCGPPPPASSPPMMPSRLPPIQRWPRN